MGDRESDDLASVRRVGENFLIAGHGGIETDFAGGRARGTQAVAFDHRAIGEHEARGFELVGPGCGSFVRGEGAGGAQGIAPGASVRGLVLSKPPRRREMGRVCKVR